jgi:hypothetical protein
MREKKEKMTLYWGGGEQTLSGFDGTQAVPTYPSERGKIRYKVKFWEVKKVRYWKRN